MRRSAISLSILITLANAGCEGHAEGLSPAPRPPADAGEPLGDAGSLDAGAPRRTVLKRDPFGNVGEAENLLWDGDFEWYSAFSDQYGWLSGPSAAGLNYGFQDVRLGPACRSGIKCAGLKKKQVIAGLGVASRGNRIEASFWAHLAQGECALVKAYIVDMEAMVDPDVVIPPASTSPDAQGWCRYDTIVDARQAKPILVIQNATGGDVVIDDAVVKKVASATKLLAAHGPLTAEEAAMIADARAAVARLRGPHDPPPNEARRAYETWRSR